MLNNKFIHYLKRWNRRLFNVISLLRSTVSLFIIFLVILSISMSQSFAKEPFWYELNIELNARIASSRRKLSKKFTPKHMALFYYFQYANLKFCGFLACHIQWLMWMVGIWASSNVLIFWHTSHTRIESIAENYILTQKIGMWYLIAIQYTVD